MGGEPSARALGLWGAHHAALAAVIALAIVSIRAAATACAAVAAATAAARRAAAAVRGVGARSAENVACRTESSGQVSTDTAKETGELGQGPHHQ